MQRKSNSKVSTAYEQMKKDIISFRYAPQAHLSDYTIANDLNLSRSSVREAILLLERDGLVTINENGKVIVAPIGLEDVLDTLQFRLAVETAAVRRIAANGWLPEQAREQLQETHERFISCALGGEHVEQYLYDDIFHQQIVEASGSPRLLQAFHNMRLQMQRTRWLNMLDYTRQEKVAAEHTAILEALLAEDLDKSLCAYETHLGNSCEAYRIALRDEQIPELAMRIGSLLAAADGNHPEQEGE